MFKIFSFEGADHKCGTSMIALCVAERIAKRMPELKVVLCHFEHAPKDCYTPKIGESIESLKPYLMECLIDVDDLLSKALYKDNLYIIGGPTSPSSLEDYEPEMATFLLDRLRDRFDIILCDLGSVLQNPLILGALHKSNEVYMVITQQESSIRRYEWQKPLYDMLGFPIGAFIINRLTRGINLNRAEIADRLNISEPIFTVKNSKFGDYAEMEGRPLISYSDKFFNRDIDIICNRIINKAGYGKV